MKKINEFISKTFMRWVIALFIVDVIVFIPFYAMIPDKNHALIFLAIYFTLIPIPTVIYAAQTYKLIKK
jgi:hypothetical protein